jgi:hypothetical protein
MGARFQIRNLTQHFPSLPSLNPKSPEPLFTRKRNGRFVAMAEEKTQVFEIPKTCMYLGR